MDSRGGIIDCGNGCGIWGAEEDLWPDIKLPIPPKRLCDFPLTRLPPTCGVTALEPWKGVFFVFLLPLLSRSSIFFLNCFASFSSTKERPAKHSSSSNE